MAGAQNRSAAERPLSPHLQIYTPRINMVMSIFHRITGTGLYVGTLLLVWWLIATATGPEYFAFVTGILDSVVGRIVLFVYTWVLLHHMLGGVRHLIWDTGRGFDLKSVDALCWGTIFGSILLTAALWLTFGL